MKTENEYIDKRKEKYQYQASMTDSIQLDYFRQISTKKAIYEVGGHKYCDDFISVTFENGISKKYNDFAMSKKELRDYLYENGFIHNGKKYVRYQRSSGSARLGNCLFINEKYYKKMIKFSNMGLNFEDGEPCDDASLFAYQSLTLSTKLDDIIIMPNEILLIDDQCTSFNAMASLTQINERGKVYVETKEIEHRQDIWDGQSLLDRSVFDFHGYSDKGMLLLRNHFFKSACFNTNIQEYYAEHGIDKVTDMFGRELDAKNIKLITTPNSVKALKFSYKKQNNEKMYDYWLKKIVDFGLVKYEKPSKFGSYNRTAYQMINSLPFGRRDISEIMKEEIDYINLINNDVAVFRHRLSISQPKTNYSFVMNMITVNDDIKNTKIYKDARRKVVDSHKKKLLLGKIRIANTDYFTMVSMPYEMLEYSAFGELNPIMNGYTMYTKYFEDGEELTGFRNPHVMSSNVAYIKNEYHEVFNKYFNFTNNIVILNCWDNDITSRLQGADFDSDTVLLTSNPVILKRAKEVINHPTPVNGIQASKIQRYYKSKDFSDVDYTISTNKIGEIINLSQLFNSHYWSTSSKSKKDLYYDCASMLSSMSQVEIDKAKKLFDFSMVSAMKHIKNLSGVNANVKPNFFRYIVDKPKLCEFTEFETPMDYVYDEVKKIASAKRSKNVPISKFIKYDGRKSTYSQVERFKEVFSEASNEILRIRNCNNLEDFEKYRVISVIEEKLVEDLSSKSITAETLADILRRCESDFSEFKTLILKVITTTHAELFNKILLFSKKETEKIVESDDGEIVIFGKKYAKKRQKP